VSITYSTLSDDADGVVEDINRLSGRGVAIRADSANMEAAKAAIGSTASRFGALDIVVNNAAMFRVGLIDDFSARAQPAVIFIAATPRATLSAPCDRFARPFNIFFI
jgi:NAD(P)-dependent dehydrogenase (short-subunit alcohol dehydrogenase family)